MALRRAFSHTIRSQLALPMKGGGGGPVKMAPPPTKPLPLWDELWYDDGQLHSQPILDGVGEPTIWTPRESVISLFTALGCLGAVVGSVWYTWDPNVTPYVQHQYPPDVLKAYESKSGLRYPRP